MAVSCQVDAYVNGDQWSGGTCIGSFKAGKTEMKKQERYVVWNGPAVPGNLPSGNYVQQWEVNGGAGGATLFYFYVTTSKFSEINLAMYDANGAEVQHKVVGDFSESDTMWWDWGVSDGGYAIFYQSL